MKGESVVHLGVISQSVAYAYWRKQLLESGNVILELYKYNYFVNTLGVDKLHYTTVCPTAV